MKKLFIETTTFTSRVAELLDDQAFAEMQKRLLNNPDAGKVMAGCGGLRKIRAADPRRQKGKRGGVRIIYLHVPQANWILLLDIYDKDEKEDLTRPEKRFLKRLADEFKTEALAVTNKEKD